MENVGREKVISTLADRIVNDFSLEQITYSLARSIIGVDIYGEKI
jgi:hypothetical protein